ncbi:MAG: molybdopterin-binding protein [Thermodesulfovibrio sp.]|nr:molybdopterin-binding protein [Thermodesulfovibrio sp.]
MCDVAHENSSTGIENNNPGVRKLPAAEAIGTVLAHDITEIRPGEFKGRAFKKGHIIKEEDVCHLQRLGKEHLFVLDIAEDEMHEDDAAYVLAHALIGRGVMIKGEPKEGKINIIAEADGLLKVNKDALLAFNMLGEVMCATVHNNTMVKKGQTVAATRAIPLIVKKKIVDEAVGIANTLQGSRVRGQETTGQNAGIIEVKEIRKPKAGVVITGNEVYYGRIKDAFAPVITRKIEGMGGEIVGTYYAPDDEAIIEARLRELLNAGADLLITTGGMSVDPDDVTRFAIRNLGATGLTYGSAVLPGAMFLVGYIQGQAAGGRQQAEDSGTLANPRPDPGTSPSDPAMIPILGIPACGMYAQTTIFDLILPRVLAGEVVGRRELAELGHGGLCLKCEICKYPVCPFGK